MLLIPKHFIDLTPSYFNTFDTMTTYTVKIHVNIFCQKLVFVRYLVQTSAETLLILTVLMVFLSPTIQTDYATTTSFTTPSNSSFTHHLPFNTTQSMTITVFSNKTLNK
jgi:hypothetical protein